MIIFLVTYHCIASPLNLVTGPFYHISWFSWGKCSGNPWRVNILSIFGWTMGCSEGPKTTSLPCLVPLPPQGWLGFSRVDYQPPTWGTFIMALLGYSQISYVACHDIPKDSVPQASLRGRNGSCKTLYDLDSMSRSTLFPPSKNSVLAFYYCIINCSKM